MVRRLLLSVVLLSLGTVSSHKTAQFLLSLSDSRAGKSSQQSRAMCKFSLRGGDPHDKMAVECANSFVSNALESIRIVFLKGDNKGVDTQTNVTARPLFAHQIFGENETIVGYHDPSVSIVFAADSLLPSLSFEFGSMVQDDQVVLTDVVRKIREHAPADYVDLPHLRSTLGSCNFEPLGSFLGDYSSALLKGFTGASNAGADDVRYELRRVTAGPQGGEEVRKFLRRTQSVAVWFIEKASYIDVDDPNWSCILLYQKCVCSRSTRYELVGFTTLYRKPIDTMDAEALRQLTPLSEEIVNQTGTVRLNLAQFVILPHFSGRGHGTQLLRCVYQLARRDAQVLDVAVEDPNADFSAMRLKCDLEYLRDHACIDALKSAQPPWSQLQRQLKLSMPRLFVLADEVGSKAGQRGVKTEAATGFPTVAGVPVDLESVYERAGTLGFTRSEIDDILQGIAAEDLAGVQSPEEGAKRLLVAVLMAVVADLGAAEGLDDDKIDVLLEAVDAEKLLEAASPRALATQVLPIVRRVRSQGR